MRLREMGGKALRRSRVHDNIKSMIKERLTIDELRALRAAGIIAKTLPLGANLRRGMARRHGKEKCLLILDKAIQKSDRMIATLTKNAKNEINSQDFHNRI